MKIYITHNQNLSYNQIKIFILYSIKYVHTDSMSADWLLGYPRLRPVLPAVQEVHPALLLGEGREETSNEEDKRSRQDERYRAGRTR